MNKNEVEISVEKEKEVLSEKQLSAILESHHRWVKSEGREGEKAVLGNYDLSGLHLAGLDLSYVDLHGADLHGMDLTGTTFSHANLTGACLKNAELSFSTMRGTRLSHADFSEANLSHTNFFGSFCDYANFHGAQMTEANFLYANLHNADLTGVDAVSASFSNTMLVAANMSGSKFLACDFTDADASLADLSSCNANESTFIGTKLHGANLSNSTFCFANMKRADIRETNQEGTLMYNTQIQQLKTDETIFSLIVHGQGSDVSAVFNADRDQISFLPDTRHKKPVSLKVFQAYAKDHPRYVRSGKRNPAENLFASKAVCLYRHIAFLDKLFTIRDLQIKVYSGKIK